MKEFIEKNRIGVYNAIDKIEFKDGTTSYFLTNSVDKDFDCDLKGNLWFNETDETLFTRTPYKEVGSLQEILDFMSSIGIDYDKYLENDVLKIGGSHDMLLYPDLSFIWEDTVLDYEQYNSLDY